MNVLQWVGIVSGLVSLPILIGGAWALVRGSFNKARVLELREDNDDLRKRNNDLDIQHAADVIKHEALETSNSQKDAEIELLTSMLTQRAEVGEVLTLLNAHHDEAEQHWVGMDVAMKALLKRSEENHAD